jgi:glycosyltransferase involved in cell wall biosynthesis
MSVLDILARNELQFRVFRYGSYNESDYKRALQRSKFMLCLDAHESQGFALEEAMACNVPLLVMDATSMYDEMDDGVHATYDHLRPKSLKATSVPYWSDECGLRITEKSELPNAVNTMLSTYATFTPRAYVERTLSDKVCMQRILEYFKLPHSDHTQ